MGLPPDFAPKTEPEQNPNGGQSPGEGVGGGKTFYGCKDFLLLDNSNYSAARLMSVPVSSSCHLYC